MAANAERGSKMCWDIRTSQTETAFTCAVQIGNLFYCRVIFSLVNIRVCFTCPFIPFLLILRLKGSPEHLSPLAWLLHLQDHIKEFSHSLPGVFAILIYYFHSTFFSWSSVQVVSCSILLCKDNIQYLLDIFKLNTCLSVFADFHLEFYNMFPYPAFTQFYTN